MIYLNVKTFRMACGWRRHTNNEHKIEWYDSECDNVLNIITVGKLGVGKTSLLMQFSDGIDSDEYHVRLIPRFGLELKVKNIELDGKKIKLRIWDTGGIERYRILFSSYFRKCQGACIVYDITDSKSFESLPYWMGEIDEYSNSDVPKLLVGNKSDLESQRQVSIETAEAYANSLGMPYLETSAKDNTNVEQVFVTLTALIMKQKDGTSNDVQNSNTLSTRLNLYRNTQKKRNFNMFSALQATPSHSKLKH